VSGERAEEIVLPDPPEILKPEFLRAQGWKGKLKAALAMFGPGAIIASATLGSGEVIWAPRAAAIFGFTIIWAYVYGTIFKFGVTYPMVRYITVSGESPIQRLKDIPPFNWVVWLFIVMILICTASWNAAFIGMDGTLMVSMTGMGDIFTWGITLMLIALALVIIGKYDLLEKGQVAIVFGIVIAMWIAVIIVQPDWIAFLKGLIPQVPEYPEWIKVEYPEIAAKNVWVELAMYMGALGGGLYDYIAFLRYARERGWGILADENASTLIRKIESIPKGKKIPLAPTKENIERAKAWLKAPLYDQIMSYGVAIVLGCIPFLALGATILHPQHQVPSGFTLVEYQVQFLEVISKYAVPFYWLGIFFALFGTTWSMLDTHASSLYELFRVVWPKVEEIGYRKFRYFSYFWEVILGSIIFLTGVEPAAAVTFGGTLGGVFGVGLFGFLLLYADRARIPEEFRMSKKLTALLLISSVFLFALGSYSMYQIISGWF